MRVNIDAAMETPSLPSLGAVVGAAPAAAAAAAPAAAAGAKKATRKEERRHKVRTWKNVIAYWQAAFSTMYTDDPDSMSPTASIKYDAERDLRGEAAIGNEGRQSSSVYVTINNDMHAYH